MNALKKLIAKLDRLQQNRPWLAFPVAVWKKFGDDQAGNLAALIAYYGFASLFPLLLVFVTVLNIVLAHDPALRDQVLNSAFSHFPVIGTQLKANASQHTLHGSAPALIIGLILTFLGARGVAAAAQNALNTVWGVPLSRRAGFPWSLLKQLGLILAVGIGLLATRCVRAGGRERQRLGRVPPRSARSPRPSWSTSGCSGSPSGSPPRDHGPADAAGPVLSAIVWQILQLLGSYLVAHQLPSSSVYGVFGIVLGLLAWLYLQAQFTLYAVEATWCARGCGRAASRRPRSLARTAGPTRCTRRSRSAAPSRTW